MEIKDFLKYLSDEARELCSSADWYDSHHAYALSEHYRYAQSVVCDLIDFIPKECKDMDAVDDLFDQMCYASFNEYKYFQDEHFIRFAELAMTKYRLLGGIVSFIESNK